jgi:hypothetical protein
VSKGARWSGFKQKWAGFKQKWARDEGFWLDLSICYMYVCSKFCSLYTTGFEMICVTEVAVRPSGFVA